jgi:hypothetical protein
MMTPLDRRELNGAPSFTLRGFERLRVQNDICRPAVKLLVIKGRLTDTV